MPPKKRKTAVRPDRQQRTNDAQFNALFAAVEKQIESDDKYNILVQNDGDTREAFKEYEHNSLQLQEKIADFTHRPSHDGSAQMHSLSDAQRLAVRQLWSDVCEEDARRKSGESAAAPPFGQLMDFGGAFMNLDGFEGQPGAAPWMPSKYTKVSAVADAPAASDTESSASESSIPDVPDLVPLAILPVLFSRSMVVSRPTNEDLEAEQQRQSQRREQKEWREKERQELEQRHAEWQSRMSLLNLQNGGVTAADRQAADEMDVDADEDGDPSSLFGDGDMMERAVTPGGWQSPMSLLELQDGGVTAADRQAADEMDVDADDGDMMERAVTPGEAREE